MLRRGCRHLTFNSLYLPIRNQRLSEGDRRANLYTYILYYSELNEADGDEDKGVRTLRVLHCQTSQRTIYTTRE